MIHPSYVELMKVVNQGVDVGDEPVINSRYSIVCATAKRARQLIDHRKPLIENSEGMKPLSIAVEELWEGKLRILTDEEAAVEQEKQDAYDEKVREERARQKEEERLKAEAEAEARAAERAAGEDSDEEEAPVEGGLSVFASEDEDFTPHAGDDEGDDDEE
ncbi:MAG: DNA-directed RNA polymerase subunit omega [Lachnospiraceae bacterium]|nr:DNA-directed RNA polymerase subunit omega [Lachnospiraceae bacterium]